MVATRGCTVETKTLVSSSELSNLVSSLPGTKQTYGPISPLNYIQEQQVKDFQAMGVSAVCVNQNTKWKEVKKKKPSNFSGEILKQRKEGLRAWRCKKFKAEAITGYISLEDIATDQALDAIARSKHIVDLGSLDSLKPQWPQRDRWGQEVLELLEDLRKEIETEKKEKAAKRIEDQARKKEARKEEARHQEVENMHRREAELIARRQHETMNAATPLRSAAATHQPVPQPPPFMHGSQPVLRSQPPLVQGAPPQHLVPPRPQHWTPPRNQHQGPPIPPPGSVGRPIGRVFVGSDGQPRLATVSLRPMTPQAAIPQPPLHGHFGAYPTPRSYTPATPYSTGLHPHAPRQSPPTGYSPQTPQPSRHHYQVPTPSSSTQNFNPIQRHPYMYPSMTGPPLPGPFYPNPPPVIPRPIFFSQSYLARSDGSVDGLGGAGDHEQLE
ncbi:hypothetical protein RSOLAG22IIIB_10880 [Rhizoctonia solani]|uniref:Uncharacterized protein n=1 Tax=Rhizoctonia solani TaxID=456999 RepID=A0A0K6G5K8_9AGAM|nr:hypothetical protein RSOLAG22IIIB_10880 [Rhizoctonia solani]